MVPRTYPCTYLTANGKQQMDVYFLSSVTGLERWKDYIPVKSSSAVTVKENSYDNDGVILIKDIGSTYQKQAWKDYIPVFIDSSATDAWKVDSDGFIPTFPTPSLSLDFTSSDETLDPLITFTRASNATRINSSGFVETVNNDVPRFTYDPVTKAPQGLLIEEQRTNSIRNNTMQGAVVGVIGSGGSLPTNWSTGGTITGLTISVIGTGTENGINYIDIRFNGTAGAVLNPNILFDTSTGIVAANGQSWSWSSYVSLVGGSLSNVTSIIGVQIMINNVPSSIGTLAGSPFVPTNAALNTQRQTFTATLNQATTAYVRPSLQFSVANGAAIDITLRIGLPQLEQGAFVTSVIPTTTAAATRAADVATITGSNFSGFYNQNEGTLFADVALALPASGGNQFIFRASANDYNNAVALNVISTGFSSISTVSGGVFDGAATANTILTANVFAKFAGGYATNNLGISLNGASVVTDTSATIPTSTNRIDIGRDHAGATANGIRSGTIRKLAYYPTRLSNAQLQNITS